MSDSAATQPTGAMAGLKVIDLARVLSGPYCSQILGDHGATVIKVEPPQGDETRDWGPPFHEGDASYFVGLNRNKRSIGLDLRTGQGRDVLLGTIGGKFMSLPYPLTYAADGSLTLHNPLEAALPPSSAPAEKETPR